MSRSSLNSVTGMESDDERSEPRQRRELTVK